MKEKLQQLITHYPGRFEISEGEKWYIKEQLNLRSARISEATLYSHVGSVLNKLAKEANLVVASNDTNETLVDKLLDYSAKLKKQQLADLDLM